MTSSRDLSRASLPRDKAFLPYALRVHQLLMGETPKTALVHHLSRYTAATMYPRQIDARLEWCDPLFRTRSLDLTDNFFPPESLGTNVSKILISFIRLEFYRQNFFVEPHIPSCQGTALYEVTAIYS
ncbi:MAG: hypothetical protein QNJ41_09615 [Xenococcaceae cyanobacterium MO_188.B32]|nr:hypothetical protein [Xenococcaceae cyanobacterium MO_188.B32]